MHSYDIVISPMGFEDPKIHIVSINNSNLNVAIELRRITLIGEPRNENRQLSVNTATIKKIFKNDSENNSANILFYTIMKKVETQMVDHKLIVNETIIKNIAYDGLPFLVVYYLLSKHFKVPYVNDLIIKTFDKVIGPQRNIEPFILYITKILNKSLSIGSVLHCLTKEQILHSNNITHILWKVLYINRILQPVELNQYVDWTFMRCVAKRTFSDRAIIDKVIEGGNIKYIQKTASKQEKLSTAHIKEYAKNLKNAALEINYTLDDLSVVLFYQTGVKSLLEMLHRMNDKKHLDNIIDQYLSITSLLLRFGIIHNDPSLENMILHDNKLILINYEKAILSKDHWEPFDTNEISANITNLFPSKQLSDSNDQIFNCYAAYDIIRFLLTIKKHKFSSPRHPHEKIDRILSKCVSILKQIDQESGVTSNWISELVGEPFYLNPVFVSSRRRQSGKRKLHFLSNYIQSGVITNEA